MTTKITEQNISELANAGVDWQAVVTADGSTTTTLVAGRGYFIDTTSAAHTVVLPTTPNVGDTIQIRDYAGTFGTNNLTVDRNGHNLGGSAVNGSITSNNTFLTYVYVDSTKGWLTLEAEAQSNPLQSLFTVATGGTITTSGDYKIHTFTGDGCFVVSTVGNSPANPTGGPDVVDYLVVAGGGSGGNGNVGDGGGGGGAGGYRESSGAASGCYSASPLGSGVCGITVTTTTYPVTVGAGGGSTGTGCGWGNAGSNSIFSTITSAGGGFGDANGNPGPGFLTSGKGGSGGGGHQNAGADGNTPPVSPPQGNPGGAYHPSGTPSGAGGGGAGSAGSNGDPFPSPNNAGPGGNGVTSSITASPVTRAGGGGGSNAPSRSPSGTFGSGGPGGGGNGGELTGCNATANTGSGGGGAAGCGSGGGGKGIVVIRYKFQ